jgi:LCP family protein required for cell wall assembly
MIDFKRKLEEEMALLENNGNEEEKLIKSKKKRRAIIYTASLAVVALIFTGKTLISSQIGGGFLFNGLKHLVPDSNRLVQGESEDRVNILLLGIGGEGHDGAYLTDTMILASIKPSSKQMSLISIPRDLTSPVSNWRKLNSISAYAEKENPGSGGEATSQAIAELFQVPINYYVRIDFDGFSKIIDELGGIEVDVENTLDDYSYPINGQEDNPDYYARFEHLHIEKGKQEMDGDLALKYARSRHAYGSEGSDFARARRQQLVLEAVKNKLLSTSTLLNPVTVSKLINEFNKDIQTNISIWEMLRIWELAKDVDRANIINQVLSDAPDNFLVAGKGEDGAYILTVKNNDYQALQELAKNIFENNKVVAKIEPLKKSSKLIILNGTWISGLAGKESEELAAYNYQTVFTGNAPVRNFEKNIIYPFNSQKTEALSSLESLSEASIDNNVPAWALDYLGDFPEADYLLILGNN